MLRTHSCGELTEKSIGKKTVLCGWVATRRDHGNLIFIDLRDRYGITQIVFNSEKDKKLHDLAKKLRNEFVVCVEGKVARRPKGTENKKIKTGKIEVNAEKLNILSEADPLPFELESRIPVNEDVRLKYRYLDLRNTSMQRNLILRHKIVKAVRDYFDKRGFLEIETPMLAKSTPEGARDYLVPSRRHFKKFFALPQSPQLFKQILMVSGFDKYFQIVKCFRDEDLRADRQPEFTQIDVEMSFIEEEDLFKEIEGMMKYVFEKVLKKKIKTPFPKMSFEEAMNKFGSDKPDTRFGMHLVDVTSELKGTKFNVFEEAIGKGHVIKALNAKGCACFSKGELKKLTEIAKTFKAKGLVTIKVLKQGIDSQIAKFLSESHVTTLLKKTNAKENDLVLLVADENSVACTALGQIRLFLGKKLNLIPKEKFECLWVVDFPLLEYSEEEKKLQAVHHPFTAPKEEDLDLIEKEPLKVRSRGYDLVLNGVELGGGSIRIHDRRIQERMFKVLGISKEEAEKKFGFLLNAFKFGAPPHGGIALGLDRFVMVLAGVNSIRDVIAFPKNKACISLMDDAPSEVKEEQLKELHLKLKLD